MARRIQVELLGDASQLERTFSRAGQAGTRFNRDLSHATRGALAGSGIFKGLGRSIAFASGGFLAFASVGQFFRHSIDAAIDAQRTQKQLAAQFKASGLSLKQYQGEIDQTADRLSLLSGFQNDELKAGFITIFRTTGNVGKSLKDLALATDLARAKHLSLNQAALIVAKTEAGNTTLLRRQGFAIAKHVTAQQALATVAKAVAGQAQAGTTAQERFGAVLHNTEEIIGAAILPMLNKYLYSFSVWLTKLNESGALQRNVASAARLIGAALHDVRAIVVPVAHGFQMFSRAVGGSKNAIKLLTAGFAAFKIAGMLSKLGLLTDAFGGLAAAETAASGGSIGGLGGKKGLGKAEAEGSRLGKLGKLGKLGAGLLGGATAGFVALGGGMRSEGKSRVKDGRWQVNLDGKSWVDMGPAHSVAGQPLNPFAPNIFGSGSLGLGALKPETARPLSAKTTSPRGMSLQGQFNMADYRLAQAGLTTSQADDRRALVAEAAIVKEQIAKAKTLADKTKLTQQLGGIVSQIQGIDDQAAQQRAEVARKAKEAKAKAQQFSVPLKLQLAQAKADALAAATGSPDLTKGQINAAKAVRTAALKAIHSHRLGLQGLIDAWNTVSSVNSQLQSQTSKGMSTTYVHVAKSATLKGLGLSRDQMVAIQEREAQLGAHRGFRPTGPAALGQGIHVHGDVVLTHPIRNVDKLYSELEKVGKRRGQRRGSR